MTGDRDRSVGRAVGLTLALLGAIVALDAWVALRFGLDRDVGLYVLERAAYFLPIGAALVVGQVRRATPRLAAAVCIAATLTMVLQDVAPASEATVLKRQIGFNQLDGTWAERREPNLTGGTEGRTLPIALDYALGRIPEADLRFRGYAEDSPRLHVTYAFWKLGYLLAPFVAIGFVLGARTWVARNLRARTRGAERTILFVLAWVVGPIGAVMVAQTTETFRENILIRGPLPLILLPPLSLSVIAALGWRAAVRRQVEREDAEALPGID